MQQEQRLFHARAYERCRLLDLLVLANQMIAHATDLVSVDVWRLPAEHMEVANNTDNQPEVVMAHIAVLMIS